MKHLRLPRLLVAGLLAAGLTRPLVATNGMNMEGYGPVATALGGASFAFDNGTAAVINNPATLALMIEKARFDFAVGVLAPDITATSPTGQRAKSKATAFFMPAVGYAARSGAFTYGLGVFGQGGMGCQYDGATWRGLGFNLENRTEVSVGRVIAPLAWKVSDQLSVAATADFVWAGMDLKMAMSGAQFFDLADPRSQQFGRASGGIVAGFNQIMQQMPAGTSVDYAYFNFANGNAFTGAAKGYGYAGKIGLLYRPVPELAIGLTYHGETTLSDLKAGDSKVSFQLNVPGMGRMPQTLAGEIRVRDFEWPAMAGIGVAWAPAGAWSFAADLRRVFWSDVMQGFNMAFTAATATSNGNFSGQTLNATLFQRWSDQTVIQAGAAYRVNREFTFRFGGNVASNPIPDKFLNCLFPATIERHLTAGLTYRFSESSSLEGSVTKGFKVTRTNGYGITVSHEQLNTQLMYSYRF
ncbi:MAG: outer membrane protein transport protein [Verrucomicrobia bacterium]|nr:outer membrane protein transport protein [Verrucomicrobiota bacterium]